MFYILVNQELFNGLIFELCSTFTPSTSDLEFSQHLNSFDKIDEFGSDLRFQYEKEDPSKPSIIIKNH